MEIIVGLMIIVGIYMWVLAMDRFFKSCSHYGYIQFLKGTGLEIKCFHITWTTTAFNKVLISWGKQHERLQNVWFTLGLFASLILIPISTYILLLSFVRNFWSSTNEETIVQPIVPGINLPASEIGYYSATLLISSVLHELGHALASVHEDVNIINEFAETAMNELLGWYGYDSNKNQDARPFKSSSRSNSSEPKSPKCNEGCGWCGKTVDEGRGLSSSAATFCSELCFSQSRRANFKKNKTCDWCRHVRHTVSYVDSQDGASQLQFCSDKCLNQYKMHIFWRETRAHLEIHPHIHGEESSSGTLITPDLWMNNGKSPELQMSSPSTSPSFADNRLQSSPLPLITVAHPSKLMTEVPDLKRQKGKVQKKSKKKAISVPSSSNADVSFSSEMPQDLRVRHATNDLQATSSCSYETKTKQSEHRQEFNSHKKSWDGLIPPPTVLVPYPILLPVPIPVPIPIPIIIPQSLVKNKNDKSCKDQSSQTELDVVESAQSVIEEQHNSTKVRPSRKRKRSVEKKSKFVIKNEKILSA